MSELRHRFRKCHFKKNISITICTQIKKLFILYWVANFNCPDLKLLKYNFTLLRFKKQWKPKKTIFFKLQLQSNFKFVFYFLLTPENSLWKEEKKILVKPLRGTKIFRGVYWRLRWFYFNFYYFFLITIIFRYFYYAPKMSVQNYKNKILYNTHDVKKY